MRGTWTLPPPGVGVHRIHGMLGARQQRPRSDRFGDADVGQQHVGLTGLSGQHRIGAYKRLRGLCQAIVRLRSGDRASASGRRPPAGGSRCLEPQPAADRRPLPLRLDAGGRRPAVGGPVRVPRVRRQSGAGERTRHGSDARDITGLRRMNETASWTCLPAASLGKMRSPA
jgi:hypothetical protein